jgi:hypothetical protein
MVADEVRAELDAIGSAAVAPGLTELAIQLARTFDLTPVESGAVRAQLADKLAAVLTKLRALSPPAVKGDALDELTAQRRLRRRTS